jgi:pimeloyl-ACP methyl ester carboxylesterase
MFDLQSQFVFPVNAVRTAGPLPKGAERLSVVATDGTRLEGIFIPPRRPVSEETLILGFGGNAWNAQDVAEYLRDLYPDQPVVSFYYRGYRPSGGDPSGKALVADAALVFDEAVARVRPKHVIAVGFSIGTGVAAQLASARKLDGLILVTPFDSLKAVAQSMMPWVPIGAFFSHEIDAATPLKKSPVPVAIIAAERDELVPAERTDALRNAVRNLVFDRTIPKASHNSIYTRSDFQDAMRSAAETISSQVRQDGTG